jgi:hypothetical protein
MRRAESVSCRAHAPGADRRHDLSFCELTLIQLGDQGRRLRQGVGEGQGCEDPKAIAQKRVRFVCGKLYQHGLGLTEGDLDADPRFVPTRAEVERISYKFMNGRYLLSVSESTRQLASWSNISFDCGQEIVRPKSFARGRVDAPRHFSSQALS